MIRRNTLCTRVLLACLFSFLINNLAVAQVSTSSSARRGLATVIFAGLGGAVLGLSTLSFYGEPQEHIGNIWTGLFLGAAGGTAYVLSTASQPNPSYEGRHLEPPKRKTAPTLIAWSWEF